MKPANMHQGTIQGDLGGDKILMEIDSNSLAHLMSVLTDLYSDPEKAIIREYSTNALDSHIEAGQTRPIEVTLPTEWDPYFIVKDFGVGLSVNDIADVYSKYGASTKRDTDDQTGMLGLGGKSALTYTSQFIVTAVKGGVKAQVSVSRAEDGTGVMEVVDTKATDEPNGVEIRIPAKFGSRLDSKARDFFKFWKPGTVLLNGEDPTVEPGQKISDNLFMVDGRDGDRIVMGNVAYPLSDNELSHNLNGNYYRNFSIVAYVNMGDVHFTPSREELSYTTKTKATIQHLIHEIKANVEKSIREQVAAAKTHGDALKVFAKWQNLLTNQQMPKGVLYQGAEVKTFFSVNNVRFQHQKSRNASFTYSEISLEDMTASDSLVITGYKSETTPTSNNKSKIREYIATHYAFSAGTGSIKNVYLMDEMPGAPWTDGIETVDWKKDIASIKLNTNVSMRGLGGARPIQMFNGTGWVDCVDLDAEDEVYYFSPVDGDYYYKWVQVLHKMYPDVVFLELGRNRWTKLGRMVKDSHEISVLGRKAITEARDLLEPDDFAYAKIPNRDIEILKAIKKSGVVIDDPEIVELARIASIDTSRIRRYNELCNQVGGSTLTNPYSETGIVQKKYPLALTLNNYGHQSGRSVEHFAIYANAVYAAESKES